MEAGEKCVGAGAGLPGGNPSSALFQLCGLKQAPVPLCACLKVDTVEPPSRVAVRVKRVQTREALKMAPGA